MRVREYGLPCVWVTKGGYTFRWGRPDSCISVFKGTHSGFELNRDFVEKIPVRSPWVDVMDVRVQVDKWLRAQERKGVR